MTKKEEFLKQKNSMHKALKIIIAVLGIIAIGLTVMMFVPAKKKKEGAYYAAEINYSGQEIQMTDIPAVVNKEGKIEIPLEDVQKYGIVYVPYSPTKPLTAFFLNDGRLAVAVSICEPCRGFRFKIQDNALVCMTCGTRWSLLDNLKGIDGGCTAYPPDEIPYEVKDGKILVDKNIVDAWQPRV
ncbi:DUF2318 domain-containing protein [Carboxydothermus hydrogenoformans]|uniref:Membrane iron-sulfur containing protein FtrD-like domain-containing protein n=1 Tax=Carboxydothermus hydrogenoformans (strain ATCC BAA-161 / DSM 6008 / Z-2901) TaxID=246194 RepID=Q3AAC1_CARHZ|nr:DUF2318 domain-containing protein [Carboxydothermus hydrogenoformans]ABB14973.1 hypothetical protein CHY_2094 [Carboxydothermus hydrogenoformans Z-2901]